MEKGYALLVIAASLLVVFFARSFLAGPSFFDFKVMPIINEGVGGRGASFKPEDNAQRLVLGLRMDVNKATGEELALLPGIGPGLSARIIAKREELGGFGSVEELKDVKGIGDAKFSAIRDYVEAGER